MLAFNAAGKAPGVYMQEVDVPGPIASVSTGVVAIVGPAQSGPLNTPVFVTNWTQFTEKFGGYIYAPQVYAPLAVRGFFENGGSVCCFVRAGVARQASIKIFDTSSPTAPKEVFTVTAKNEGKKGNDISVAIKKGGLCSTVAAKCEATVDQLSADRMTLLVGEAADAIKFLAGDIVCVVQGAVAEEAEVASVSSDKKSIVLKSALVKAFDDTAATTVKLANLADKKRVRLLSSANIEAGTYLKFSQTQGSTEVTEHAVVSGLDGDTVLFNAPLKSAFDLAATAGDIAVESIEFTLEISYGAATESYENLSVVPYHSRYYEKLTVDSALVTVEPSDPPNPSLAPLNSPNPGYALNSASLSGGVDDNPGGLAPSDYFDAIDALKKVEVNIVCVPDAVSFGPSEPAVTQYVVTHCELMGDRFAILDGCRNLSVAGMLEYREKNLGASSYAAVYYPWIEVPHPAGQGRIKIPPSGHIAGVYARTDDQKGVHKAPGNEVIKGSLGPVAVLTDAEHGMLNEVSVNAIVNVPGGGTTLMGARTLSNGTQWRYINVRRLLLYIEKSIQNSTRFAVFLPNNPSLWATVKRQVSDFLNTVWRSGALFGATPDLAYRVKVDEELNPPSVRALGQLIIEVVLYPVTPAEYIVFRIVQQPGGVEVSE